MHTTMPPPPAPAAAIAPSPPPPRSSRPHAVVLGWPGQGHINPLLHLSRRLIHEGGYIITFVNTHHNHERVLRSQQPSSKLPTAKKLLLQKEAAAAEDDDDDDCQDIRFVSIPDGMPDDSDRMAQMTELCRKVVEFMPAESEKLIDSLMRGPHPVTLILSDVFVLHTQDVANKYAIPRVGFWTQSAASFALHLHCARGYRAPPEAYEGKRVIFDIPGCPPLSQSEMLTFLQPYDPADFMFRFSTEPFHRLHECEAILLNTYEELERACMEALRKEVVGTMLYSSGPILPEAFFQGRLQEREAEKVGIRKNGGGAPTIGVALWREDYECLKWLDGKGSGSVVYVAFGSIAVLRKEVVVEFAHALEASGLAFLWVLRPGMVDGFSSEHNIMPDDDWLRRIEGRAKIITWAPQLHVLTHPSVGAFLTHAGWNSTLEGIASGLPMFTFPYFADQMLNSRRIHDLWHLGPALRTHAHGLLHRDDIRRHLLTLMNNPHIRANARKLRDAAFQRHEPPSLHC